MENSFQMSLFFSSCFSFQTRMDLVLVKFYHNAAVRRFSKTFIENLLGNDCDKNHFYESLSYSKCTQLRASFYQFLQKRFPLNGNIVCANTPESSQIYQKVEAFFLLSAPKYLGPSFFILSTRKFYVFSEMHSSQKKSVKLENFLCKNKSSQNFLKSLV